MNPRPAPYHGAALPLSYPSAFRGLSTLYCRAQMERAMGIEPTYQAWKACVLPLNYTRLCRAPAFGRDCPTLELLRVGTPTSFRTICNRPYEESFRRAPSRSQGKLLGSALYKGGSAFANVRLLRKSFAPAEGRGCPFLINYGMGTPCLRSHTT